jgi:hypothetical protein
MPVPLRGVTVVADVTIVRSAHAGDVERDVKAALEGFVNPLVGGLAGEGWEFGRALNEGELYPLVQDVPGVDRVRMVRMYETDARTPETPHPTPAGARISIARNELFCSATHRVRAGGRDAA